MHNIKLFEIKYRLQTKQGWKLFRANILSYGVDFINREMIHRYGERSFEILDSTELGKIDLIDSYVIDDILETYSNQLVQKTDFKRQEKEMQRRELEKRQEKAEWEFWDQDQVINDGNLAKKFFSAWNTEEYK